jgi:hypothetical protein
VNAAGTHLLGLINQVLDLSKIEAGKLDLNPESVNLVPLIDEVIGTAGQLAEQNNNRLVVEAEQNLGAITVDPMRLRQILLNLLSNACKPSARLPTTTNDSVTRLFQTDFRFPRFITRHSTRICSASIPIIVSTSPSACSVRRMAQCSTCSKISMVRLSTCRVAPKITPIATDLPCDSSGSKRRREMQA